MIGRLQGVLLEKRAPELLLDVAGVAYELQASMMTFYRLPELGQAVTLYTHFLVREDAQLLYGFYELSERALFRSLIKVNGVGPKLALTLLSSIEPSALVQCILDDDTVSLIRLPGVGKKTAERLIVEMRDRLSDWYDHPRLAPASVHIETLPLNTKKLAVNDAINALIALGYKPPEAATAIQQIQQANQELINCEEMIRLALRSLAK